MKKLIDEIKWIYARSSGPGGQHVNTTDSKVILTWAYKESAQLNEKQKRLLKKNLSRFLIQKGEALRLSSSKFRSRERNKKACLDLLQMLLNKKAFYEKEKRKKTKPTRSSIEKRLKEKNKKSETKKLRKKVEF